MVSAAELPQMTLAAGKCGVHAHNLIVKLNILNIYHSDGVICIRFVRGGAHLDFGDTGYCKNLKVLGIVMINQQGVIACLYHLSGHHRQHNQSCHRPRCR